jgi:SAM-dependent methyltransferase
MDMNHSPFPRSARDAIVQRKLEDQADLFRSQAAEAREEINGVLDKIVTLRRNPLARPFVGGPLLDQVRKAKRLLSREISAAPPEEPEHSGCEPRTFTFSAAELAVMTPEQAALVGRMAALLIGQNLDIPYDPKVAQWSAGSVSKDIFTYVGVEWLELAIRYGRLAPSHAVLDIGCGCGRMAGPLTMYLNARGSFRGFDPIKKSIDFAQAHLRQPNFQFDFVDLNHYLYNPKGAIDSSTYRFPCEDASIDVSLAASIFTHLDLKTAAHYLRETRRVLRPGGRALYSLLAMADDMPVPEGGITRPLGKGDGAGLFRFLNRGAGFYTHCDEFGKPKNHFMPDPVGDPVAFDLQAFNTLVTDAGLTVDAYLPGGWCGREYRHGYQDMFVLRKA